MRRNPHQQHQMLERLSTVGHEVMVIDYPINWRSEGHGLIAPRRVFKGVSKVVPGAGVTVIRSAKVRISGVGKLSWLATNIVEIVRALRGFRPDVLVVLGLSNGLPAMAMARRAGVPVVIHLIDALHTLVEPPALRPVAAWVERRLLRGADHVIVVNKALANYAVDMGARPDKMSMIPSGADISAFGPHVDGAIVRREYGIEADEQVLLFIGWLYTFSGLRELATAMTVRKKELAKVRLLIVGNGDLLSELTRIRDESLGDRLIIAGQQDPTRMPVFTAAADICLLPSHVNVTMKHIVPGKLYDYLSAGKPILASPLAGVRSEFGDQSGILYVDGPEAVLQAAAELRRQPALVSSLSVASRRAAEANGTWDDVTRKYRRVLSEMAAMRKRTPAITL